MQYIPEEVNNGFHEGLCTIKMSEDKFYSAWINYVVQATEYKVLIGSRGITGLTLKGNSLTRSRGS